MSRFRPFLASLSTLALTAYAVGPILMTSLAFILGTLRLLIADGAGAELRQALGTAVFFGMIGVTAFGLLFTPTFYVVCRALGDRISRLRGGGGGEQQAQLQPAE